MKLTVFGASGRIGGEVIRQGSAAGHDVTAVARSGSTVAPLPDGTRLVEMAGLGDIDVLESAVAGSDAVLSGVGPRRRKDVGVTAPVTRHIVDAMARTGVQRIIVVSAAPAGEMPPGAPWLMRNVQWPLVSSLFRPLYDDLREMEGDLARSGLDWTSVRPPRLVTKPVTGTYRTAVDSNVPRGSRISRADVAHAMLAIVDDTSTFGHPLGVAW